MHDCLCERHVYLVSQNTVTSQTRKTKVDEIFDTGDAAVGFICPFIGMPYDFSVHGV